MINRITEFKDFQEGQHIRFIRDLDTEFEVRSEFTVHQVEHFRNTAYITEPGNNYARPVSEDILNSWIGDDPLFNIMLGDATERQMETTVHQARMKRAKQMRDSLSDKDTVIRTLIATRILHEGDRLNNSNPYTVPHVWRPIVERDFPEQLEWFDDIAYDIDKIEKYTEHNQPSN